MVSKNVVIIGGSGFWSEQNHIKNLLDLKKITDVKTVAIIDPINPATITKHKNLHTLLRADNPQWINCKEYDSVKKMIAAVKAKPDLIIIASNPETHFEYLSFCATQGIPVLVDKPILTERNASSDTVAARKIHTNFLHILQLQKQSRTPMFTLLRRRSLPGFVKIADELRRGYKATRAPITHLMIQVNGGIHKFPIEFNGDFGAHGYQQGVGALAHSAYHYIDVMMWLFSLAPGETTTLHIKLNYIKRVSDYVNGEGYAYIRELLGLSNKKVGSDLSLPENVLAAELDVGFLIEMRDNANKVIGVMNFNFNHTGFSPRLHKVETERNHSNYIDGGRMSQIYLDVHQSTVQNWQLIKNDVVFKGNNISVYGRRHPKLSQEEYDEINYGDAYDSVEYPMKMGLLEILTKPRIMEAESISRLGIKQVESELLNMIILSSFYELIAKDYSGSTRDEIVLKVSDFLSL